MTTPDGSWESGKRSPGAGSSGKRSPGALTQSAPTVVIGPRTRLGHELISRARSRGETVLAVARHQHDAEALAAQWGSDGGVQVVLGSSLIAPTSAPDSTLTVTAAAPTSAAAPALTTTATPAADPSPTPTSAHEARVDVPRGAKVFICALGPVQSGDRVDDPTTVQREVEVVRGVLASGGARVVLVSSVLALAPSADRRHYAGWKCLVEELVRRAAADHGATLAVLFPGRLVEGSQKKLHRFVHTPYPKLARLVEQSSDGAHSKSVGLDARLWLLSRGAGLASGALTGSAA